MLSGFQSTLPGWGATDSCAHVTVFNTANFNPRSPDGERHTIRIQRKRNIYISIHAPRMGSDYPVPHPCALHPIFQSTLPGWGATDASKFGWISDQFQSTLPGWGATTHRTQSAHFEIISIHAPRMGSDRHTSTRGRWRDISIHAPRMGSDTSRSAGNCGGRNFNPRSPDGERRQHPDQRHPQRSQISIHAPRMGSDRLR